MSEPSDSDDERDRALQLLRSQHTFPGPYSVRVVVRPPRRAEVVSVLGAALEGGAIRQIDEKPSRNGNYVALRIHFDAASAEEVLSVYGVLGKIDGVVAVM